MTIDENGEYRTEQPDLPVEQVIHYIVKDYRRMYLENDKLKRRIKRMGEKNTELANRCFSQVLMINRQHKVVESLVKMLKNRGADVPKSMLDF